MGTPARRFAECAIVAAGLIALVWAHRSGFESPSNVEGVNSALDHALHDPTMLEPVLALLATALLLHLRRARIASALGGNRAPIAGGLVLAVAGVLLVWSRQIGGDHLVLPALLLSLCGGALVVGGGALLRVVAWPLVPLLLAVPLPPQITNAVLFPMQLLVVSLTSALLELVGRAHEVRGDLLITRDIAFQVIEGCSGFKSMLSLVLAAIVYGELVLERSSARAALVVSAVPLGLMGNAVRVLCLILGEVPTESPNHTAIGLASLVGSVVVLALGELVVSKAFARGSADAAPASGPLASRGSEIAAFPGSRRPMGAVSVLWIGLALLVEALPIGHWPIASGVINIETVPETLVGRTSRGSTVDTAFLGTTSFGHWIQRAYSTAAPEQSSSAAVAGNQDPDAVRVFVGLEDVGRLDRTGYSPKTMIPTSGWRTYSRARNVPSGEQTRFDWTPWVIDYPTRRVLVLHARPGYAPWGLDAVAHWLGLERLGRGGGRRSPLVVRLERDVRGDGLETDWMILRQFAREIETWYSSSGA